jgi:hypothetical protein
MGARALHGKPVLDCQFNRTREGKGREGDYGNATVLCG